MLGMWRLTKQSLPLRKLQVGGHDRTAAENTPRAIRGMTGGMECAGALRGGRDQPCVGRSRKASQMKYRMSKRFPGGMQGDMTCELSLDA